MLRVAVYVMAGHRRSEFCCSAMLRGIAKLGDKPIRIEERSYNGVEHDACVFYGYIPSLQKIMADYRAANKPAVYIDLGYWRREGMQGYHKVVVNGRHPTAYFQRKRHNDDRLKALGVAIAPWRIRGRNILLAGMGYKASVIAEHIAFESFERDAAAKLAAHSKRAVYYRPKPNDERSRPIEGTTFARDLDLDRMLHNCHAVVTHHSNVAVDALVAGIPAFCWQGVAAPMALQDLARIEKPWFPGCRHDWACDISYCQWSVPEMAEGLPWRYLKDEGLL